MKYKILRILLLIVFFANYELAGASDCYHYYTKNVNTIKVEKGKVFLIKTVVDPNGISIMSYRKIPLDDIKIKNIHIVSENKDGIIIANSEFYYWLRNTYKLEQPIIKIIEAKKVLKRFGKNTFQINGMWTHIYPNPFSDEIEYTVIKDLPNNPIIIKNFENCYLIKDKSKVYAYDEEKKTIKIIPNLEANKTQFFETYNIGDAHFLYDDDTCYRIWKDFDRPDDITQSFKVLGLKNKFTEQKIIKINFDYFLDFNDGKIWVYDKNSISLKDKSRPYFYPIDKAKYYKNFEMICFNNLFYNNGWNLLYERNGIDMSLMQNKENFKLVFDNIYSDGQKRYTKNENGKIVPTNKYNEIENFSDLEMRYNNALHSCRHNLSIFWIYKKNICYLNRDLGKFENFIKYNSTIKDLKLAYAFDNKLLIENEIIEHNMDFNTIEFIGSNVRVINACDGGRGEYPVEVEYDYYFKDKNAIYLFHTGKKELEKLKLEPPKNYTQENFMDKFLGNNFN